MQQTLNWRQALLGLKASLIEHSSAKQQAEKHETEWTSPDSPSRWAKLFGFSVSTLLRRIKGGTIRHKKLSTKSYQIAIADLPAKHQDKFRSVQNPPPK